MSLPLLVGNGLFRSSFLALQHAVYTEDGEENDESANDTDCDTNLGTGGETIPVGDCLLRARLLVDVVVCGRLTTKLIVSMNVGRKTMRHSRYRLDALIVTGTVSVRV